MFQVKTDNIHTMCFSYSEWSEESPNLGVAKLNLYFSNRDPLSIELGECVTVQPKEDLIKLYLNLSKQIREATWIIVNDITYHGITPTKVSFT